MKMRYPALGLLALALLSNPLSAQVPAPNSVQSLRVLETPLPVYPHSLLQLGIREGEVRVALSVDKNGNIEDLLPIAYSHPEFARVTVAAMKKWRFDPARYMGEPIAAATEVGIKFAVEGTVVVSVTAVEMLSLRLQSMFNQADSFRPRTLSELDRIPTPIAAPSPGYPARVAQPGTNTHVTISFYIDENGAVRLPSVDAGEDPELAAAAIAALHDWKFEPPTCHGSRVLVRASQRFNFHAPIATAQTVR